MRGAIKLTKPYKFVVVERSFQKPCCSGAKWEFILSLSTNRTDFSKTLAKELQRDIG